MRAGTMRHRVTLQEKAPTRDDYHGEVHNWTDVATVWAAKEPLQGREFYDARREGAQQPVWFWIRYRDDVVPAMRLLHGDQVYGIDSVVEVSGMGRELRLMCTEVLDG